MLEVRASVLGMAPKKGGIRQRHGYEDKSSGTAKVDKVVKDLFKKGRLSATEVQQTTETIAEIAESPSAGSSSSSGLRDWAKAGASGQYPGNVSRDVIAKMGRDKKDYPALYASPCTFWDEDSCSKIQDDMHYLCLHEVLDYEIDATGGNVEEWTNLDPAHAMRNTKATWMQDVGFCWGRF